MIEQEHVSVPPSTGRSLEFRLNGVELASAGDGSATISMRGLWIAPTIRAIEAPELLVSAYGMTARARPVATGSARMLLAGPLPEPWSATYAVDPGLLATATLQLVTADGQSFDVPVADQIRDTPDTAAPEERISASQERSRSIDVNGASAPSRLEELLARERTPASEAIYWHGQEVHHGPILEVRGVSKSYGDVPALEDVELQIDPGEIFALVGSNGAGKTTLVSIIAGLVAPDRGSVEIAGIDAGRDPLQARRLVGIAPQELGLYLTLTVRQNLRFFGKLAGLHPRVLEQRIEDVAAALGLSDLLQRTPQELSGGEKRRLHTAMAMLHRPPLLLLDEPTAGVDVQTRSQFLELVNELAADGAAVCYTTHYLQEVETLGASVGILERGRIIARGVVDELVAAAAQATIELRFTQAVPRELHQFGSVVDDGCLLRMEATDSAAAVTRSASLLGTWADHISSIHVVEPSFESAYLAITGHRIAETGEIHAP